MDSRIILSLLLLAIVIALLGMIYRHFRSRDFPNISDEQFVRNFLENHSTQATSEAIVGERRRVAQALGIAPEKLSAAYNIELLSKKLGFVAEFSVAWSDLADEASEAREAFGLPLRERPPSTIGELIEDRLLMQHQ